MKKIVILGFITAMFLLGGCRNNDALDDLTDVTADAEEIVQSSEELNPEPSSIVKKGLSKDFSDVFIISYYENGTFFLDPRKDSDRYVSFVKMAMATGLGAANFRKELKNIADKLVTHSESAEETTGEKFSFIILSPTKNDPHLVEIENHKAIYPVLGVDDRLLGMIDYLNRDVMATFTGGAKSTFNFEKHRLEVAIDEIPNVKNWEIRNSLPSSALEAYKIIQDRQFNFPLILTESGAEVLRIDQGQIINNIL